MSGMTKADRDALIRIAKNRAKQAEREAETREKLLLAELETEFLAEFSREDELWAEAVKLAEQEVDKANTRIRAVLTELGVPERHQAKMAVRFIPRSLEYADRDRRTELRKLAVTRLAALTKMAKTAIRERADQIEETLIIGGLDSDEAKAVVTQMPTVTELMPNLHLDDLGVKRWQPDEDVVWQLTNTSRSASERIKRRVLRAIEANPGATDRKIAQIAGCDHKTVAKHRRDRGEIPAISGESPTPGTEEDA
jgi:hypothetical protein